MVLASHVPTYAQTKASEDRPAQKAGYVLAEKSDVPIMQVLTGRAVSKNRTQVRPRVGGVINEVLYTPGTSVDEGTALFSIDPVTYEIALAVAKANVERSTADLNSAKAAFDRAESLRGSVTSKAAIEATEATLLKAKASLGESEANFRLAETQLQWTTVRAPISGIIDVSAVAIGDLVTANQANALAEIVQSDPIYIDLTEPYQMRVRLQDRASSGEITLTEPKLAIILENGRRVEGTAKLLSTSASVSTTTGSHVLRFEMPNPERAVMPGMFLKAELTVAKTEAFLVPQRATTRERDGTLVAWVDDDGQARKRKLVESGTLGNNWIVSQGLKTGDRLLIDGTSRIRDGQKVEAVLAFIDEQGVVRDVAQKSN